MARASEAARKYMAQMGAKGGSVTGPTKARDPAHYKRLADMKRAAAKARARAKGKRA
jgi:hypothetical protein